VEKRRDRMKGEDNRELKKQSMNVGIITQMEYGFER
jgi:hypothetical protein